MNPQEEHTLVELLSKLRFPCSPEVFRAIYQNLVIVAVEVAIFTPDGKIILMPRPPDDPWAGIVHIPGSVLTPGTTEQETLLRALREVGAPELFSTPVFINRYHFMKGSAPTENKLGQEVGLLFGCVYSGPIPQDAVLADPHALPANVMPHHRAMIADGYQWFLSRS